MFEIEINYRRGGPKALIKLATLNELGAWIVENSDRLTDAEVHGYDLREVDYCARHSWESAEGPGFPFACTVCEAKITVWHDRLDVQWRQKSASHWNQF